MDKPFGRYVPKGLELFMLGQVIFIFERRANRLSIFILEACRDNDGIGGPFPQWYERLRDDGVCLTLVEIHGASARPARSLRSGFIPGR